MSRIHDLNTIRESGLNGGSNDFIPARLGIFICISYDYKREKNMLTLTNSPALSTQGSVDQISDKVSLPMEGIVNQVSLLTQTEDNAPNTDLVYGFFLFYFILLLFFLILLLSSETSLQMKHTVLILYKTIFKRLHKQFPDSLSTSPPGASEKSTLLFGSMSYTKSFAQHLKWKVCWLPFEEGFSAKSPKAVKRFLAAVRIIGCPL